MSKHLVTFYTRTPLHVGCGTSVDVVDLPIMRERITNFPVIPGSSLKGVLRQAGRDFASTVAGQSAGYTAITNDVLFGNKDATEQDAKGKDIMHAGCVQIMEAKLLAFPVRSLAGCFAWLTCPAVLRRFQRDSAEKFDIPTVEKDQALWLTARNSLFRAKPMLCSKSMHSRRCQAAPNTARLPKP